MVRPPAYLRDSRGLGLAQQRGRIEDLDLGTALKTVPATVDAETVDEILRLAENGVAAFLGGRAFPAAVGGRPAELDIVPVFDWDRATPERPAEEKTSATASVSHAATRSDATTFDRTLRPRAGFAAMPAVVTDFAAAIPAGTTQTRDVTHTVTASQSSTVQISDAVDTEVPVRFVLSVRDTAGIPVEPDAVAEATVPLRVPRGLTEATGEPHPHTGPLPTRFAVENVSGGPDCFERVAELLPRRVTEVGAPGRNVLRQFLADANLATSLPLMTAPDGGAHPERGWVTSEPLVRRPRPARERLRSGARRVGKMFGRRRTRSADEPARENRPGGDTAVQLRLVPRYAQVVDGFAEAAHTDVQALRSDPQHGAVAGRTAGGSGMVGGGIMANPLRFAVGPRGAITASAEHTLKRGSAIGGEGSHTVTGPVCRYLVGYDLEARAVGGSASRPVGTVEAIQWAREDRVDRAGVGAGGPRAWTGRRGQERRRFAPAHIEAGMSFGGAIVDDFATGDALYEAVANALRTVPGRRTYRKLLSNEFLGQFGDPALRSGLTAGVQAILARDAEARHALSDGQLALLLDRIIGPGLQVPLIRKGHLHDYHTVIAVQGAVGELSDGEVLSGRGVVPGAETTSDGGKPAGSAFTDVTDKLKNTTDTALGRQRTTRFDFSIDGRAYGMLGSVYAAFGAGPRVAVTRTAAAEQGVSQGGSQRHEHGPRLAADGTIAEQKMVEFLAPVTLTASSTSFRKLNVLGLRLTVGRTRGRTPKVVSPPALPPRVFGVDVRLLVPEHRVGTEPPRPTASGSPAEFAEFAGSAEKSRSVPVADAVTDPQLINRLAGGSPVDLDGGRVEAFTASAPLQGAVAQALVEASGEPNLGFTDGVVSAAIADALSPDRFRGDPRALGGPIVIDDLHDRHKMSTVYARAGVRLRPVNPKVLPGAEYRYVKHSKAGGVSGTRTRGRQSEAGFNAFATVSGFGPTETNDGVLFGSSGLLMAFLQPLTRRWGRSRGEELSSRSRLRLTGRVQRLVPVQLDLEAEVVAEARRRHTIDRWGLVTDDSVHRAGRRLSLPDSVVMWLTPEQADRLKAADRAHARLDKSVALGTRQEREAADLLNAHRRDRQNLADRHARERARTPVEAREVLWRIQRDRERGLRSTQAAAAAALRTRHSAEHEQLAAARRLAEEAEPPAPSPNPFPEPSPARAARSVPLADPSADSPLPAAGLLSPPPVDPGGTASLGLAGADAPLDLTGRIPHLRRRLAESLGERAAERLLPRSPLRTPHDNWAAAHAFLKDLDRHLGGTLNGGRSQPARLEDPLTGHTYYLTAQTTFGAAPTFSGIAHVGALGSANKTVLGTNDTRSRSRSNLFLSFATRAVGMALGTESKPGAAHGPATGSASGGARAVFGLGNREHERSHTARTTYKQSASTSGPVATWDGNLHVKLAVHRGARLDRHGRKVPRTEVAADRQIREVRLHALAGETLPGPLPGHARLGTAGPITALPREATTADGRMAWRNAPGHPTLPASGRFAVEHLFADVELLREAAVESLAASGAKVDAATLAAIRHHLTADSLRGALPALLDGTFRLPLPGGVDRTLHIDARLVPRPRLAGVDARVDLAGSGTGDAERVSTKSGGNTVSFAATVPTVSAGASRAPKPGEVVTPESQRTQTGQKTGFVQSDRMLYDNSGLQQRRLDVTEAVSTQPALPVDDVADPDKVTRTLSFGLEFRFAATSPPTRRAPDGKHTGGTELRVHDAVIIRLDEGAATKLTGEAAPAALRATAIELAKASTAWSKAYNARIGLLARTSYPATLAEKDTARRACQEAERAWWDAAEAHRSAFLGSRHGTTPPLSAPAVPVPSRPHAGHPRLAATALQPTHMPRPRPRDQQPKLPMTPRPHRPRTVPRRGR